MQVEDITQDENNKMEETNKDAEEIKVILLQLQRDILFRFFYTKIASKLKENGIRTSAEDRC